MRPEDKLMRALFNPDRDAPRARCPECGLKTVPDHPELTYEARLCESCYLHWSEEDHEH